MSFEIFWDKLDSDMALSLQNYLNNFFKKTKRPDFLGEVVFSNADFGEIPPEIEIVDICDPIPEFYLPDDSNQYTKNSIDSYNDSVATDWEENNEEIHFGNIYTNQELNDRMKNLLINKEISSIEENKSNLLGDSHSNRNSPENENENKKIFGTFYNEKKEKINIPLISKPSMPSPDNTIAYPNNLYMDSKTKAELYNQHIKNLRRDTDIQVELSVIYRGNLKITVSTELIINKPTPAFLVLPVKLTLIGISFKGKKKYKLYN